MPWFSVCIRICVCVHMLGFFNGLLLFNLEKHFFFNFHKKLRVSIKLNTRVRSFFKNTNVFND